MSYDLLLRDREPPHRVHFHITQQPFSSIPGPARLTSARHARSTIPTPTLRPTPPHHLPRDGPGSTREPRDLPAHKIRRPGASVPAGIGTSGRPACTNGRHSLHRRSGGPRSFAPTRRTDTHTRRTELALWLFLWFGVWGTRYAGTRTARGFGDRSTWRPHGSPVSCCPGR